MSFLKILWGWLMLLASIIFLLAIIFSLSGIFNPITNSDLGVWYVISYKFGYLAMSVLMLFVDYLLFKYSVRIIRGK